MVKDGVNPELLPEVSSSTGLSEGASSQPQQQAPSVPMRPVAQRSECDELSQHRHLKAGTLSRAESATTGKSENRAYANLVESISTASSLLNPPAQFASTFRSYENSVSLSASNPLFNSGPLGPETTFEGSPVTSPVSSPISSNVSQATLPLHRRKRRTMFFW